MEKKNELFNKLLGEKIKTVRISLEIEQSDLASFMNLSRASICNIEQGKQQVTAESLVKLSQIFGCDIKDLTPLDFTFNIPDTSIIKGTKTQKKIKKLSEKIKNLSDAQKQLIDDQINKQGNKMFNVMNGIL